MLRVKEAMPEIGFELDGDLIELNKLLKATGLCSSGGLAKQAIAGGQVKVNGAPETRKAFKVRAGHVVEFEGQTVRVQIKIAKFTQTD